MPRFSVVYDACVLYPAPLRDILIELAVANLFQAHWTDEIHEEWIENLLSSRIDLKREQLERTKRLMNDAVPDCLVSGYEYLIPTIELPDDNDRHVAAAAIHARADAIVTCNMKDFPEECLRQYNLEAIHPDDFIQYQFDLDDAAVLIAARNCRSRLQSPPIAADRYLEILRSQPLPKTVERLSAYVTII